MASSQNSSSKRQQAARSGNKALTASNHPNNQMVIVALSIVLLVLVVGTFYFFLPKNANLNDGQIPPAASATPAPKVSTTFGETGLPSGATFGVLYDNIGPYYAIISSTNSSVNFSTASGSYSYTIPSVSYNSKVYLPSPSSGTLTAGSSQKVTYTLSKITNFTEKELPSGAIFKVTVTQNNSDATFLETNQITIPQSGDPANSLYFRLPFGPTYAFNVSVAFKPSLVVYVPRPQSGTLAAGATQIITYGMGSTFSNLPLPSTTQGCTSDEIYNEYLDQYQPCIDTSSSAWSASSVNSILGSINQYLGYNVTNDSILGIYDTWYTSSSVGDVVVNCAADNSAAYPCLIEFFFTGSGQLLNVSQTD